MATLFLANQAVKFFLLGLIALSCGLLVTHREIKVNYTRKVMHFSLLLIPIYIERIFAYERTLGLFAAGCLITIVISFIFVKPLRERLSLVSLMFKAFDRPEDRPYTVLWIITQFIANYIILIPMIILYARFDLQHLITLPLLITVVGDGFAEPVGVRFGKHRYKVKALFIDREYYRTLEGSACVFIACVTGIAAFHASFSLHQFIVALLVVPVVVTLAEAISPHTWDNPLMFLVGYMSIFTITFL